MKRDEAVKIWLTFGCRRMDALHRRVHPQHVVDKITAQNAEDVIDGLVALGLLTVDQPSPQEIE